MREIVGGCAGLVGALLRLHLDGCLFGCKCLRLSYLELEFSCKYFFSAYYWIECLLRVAFDPSTTTKFYFARRLKIGSEGGTIFRRSFLIN